MNRQKKSGAFSQSRTGAALTRFSLFFYRALSESLIGRLLGGYRPHGEGSALSRAGSHLKFRHRVSVPFKRFMARGIDRSLLLFRLRRGIRNLLDLPLKALGAFYFAFGAYLSISYLIRHYALSSGAPASHLSLGILCAVLGGVFSSSSKKLGSAISESRLVGFLLFRVLGLRREGLLPSEASWGRSDVALLLGIAAGAIATLTSPYWILLGLPLLALAYAILIQPECGVVCLLLILPYIPTYWAACLCLYVTVCWLLRVMRGKRLLALNSLDLAVLAFSLLLLFGGIFSVTPQESLTAALRSICLMSGYFLAVNLIRNSEWLARCVKALLFSLSVTSLIGVVERLLGFLPQGLPRFALFAEIPGRVPLLGTPEVAAAFVVLSLPFLFSALATAGKGDTRIGLSLLALLSLLCLVFTHSLPGLIAAFVGLLLLLLLRSKKSLVWVLPSGAFLAVFLLLLPDSLRVRIGAFFTKATLPTGIIEGVDRLTGEVFLSGIGYGESALQRIFPLYAADSGESVYRSMSLYRLLTVSLGLSGLLLFAVLLLIFLRHCMFYFASSQADRPATRFTAAAGFAGTVSLLILGIHTNVWYNSRVFLMFWLVCGLTSAAVRTGVRERIPLPFDDGPSLELDVRDLTPGRAGK